MIIFLNQQRCYGTHLNFLEGARREKSNREGHRGSGMEKKENYEKNLNFIIYNILEIG
jgi:hypothetical protein